IRFYSGSGAERSRRSRKNPSAHSPFGRIVTRALAPDGRHLCAPDTSILIHTTLGFDRTEIGDADQEARKQPHGGGSETVAHCAFGRAIYPRHRNGRQPRRSMSGISSTKSAPTPWSIARTDHAFER